LYSACSFGVKNPSAISGTIASAATAAKACEL